jgi:hypothetical protein
MPAPHDKHSDPGFAYEYWINAAQRTSLFWDVTRQRKNNYHAYLQQAAPHVRGSDVEPLASNSEIVRIPHFASGIRCLERSPKRACEIISEARRRLDRLTELSDVKDSPGRTTASGRTMPGQWRRRSSLEARSFP